MPHAMVWRAEHRVYAEAHNYVAIFGHRRARARASGLRSLARSLPHRSVTRADRLIAGEPSCWPELDPSPFSLPPFLPFKGLQ